MNFEEYKERILDYLHCEKKYYEDDIKANKRLSDDQKEEQGLLIRSAKIVKRSLLEYQFEAEINNTKLRAGDKVTIKGEKMPIPISGKVIENNFENIFIETSVDLFLDDMYDIRVEEFVLIDPLIKLAEELNEYKSGAFFYQQLMGSEQPIQVGMGSIRSKAKAFLPSRLNDSQRNACLKILDRPSIHCVQGPPGTGKTDVLSTIANAFSRNNKEVLIVSNTHQAVNNALNKIIKNYPDLNVVKIGEALKAQELDERIVLARSYSDYLKIIRKQKSRKKKGADIVGMTFYGSIFNLGLRNSGFQPSIILADEAGQMPFVESSLIGSFGCGSVIFIGDDRQMPPIFHEKLKDDPWSISIFEKLCGQYPEMKDVLDTTYRMNDEINRVVSGLFYEPYGVKLLASDYSKDRRLKLDCACDDEKIKSILTETASLHIVNVTTAEDCTDTNREEADFAARLAHTAIENGMKIADVAVITPYRRQVNQIRTEMLKYMEEIPIVDTVERLQGQDVEMVVISFCVSSTDYITIQQDFLFQLNRLNVMISRAKTKVVMLASNVVSEYLDNLFKLEDLIKG